MNGILQNLRDSSDGAAALNDTTAVALILLLLFIIAVGLFFLSFVRRHARAQLEKIARDETEPPAARFSAQASSPLFDSPCRWLAVRSGNALEVQQALHLNNPVACSWEEGLAEARERRLFISPPVGEWVLVVGSGLPDPAEDVDVCFHFLRRLSQQLGHVQFFSLNRALHHHAWVRLENGRVLRAYAWAGETLWNEGRMTLDEAALGLRCFGYTDEATRTDFNEQEPAALNVEKVPALAARWSLDPTAVDERQIGGGPGITGEFSQSQPF